MRHPYLQACKQGWVRSTLPSPPHFFGNSVMENLLIYIMSFKIFRTSRLAVKEECFAPQTKEYKYEVEGKNCKYSKILNSLQISTISTEIKTTFCNTTLEICLKNSEASEDTQIWIIILYNKPKIMRKSFFLRKLNFTSFLGS